MRIEMRLNALCLIGVLTVAAVPLSAGAASAAGDRTTAEGGSQAAQSVERCSPGYYWEPDAYATHGKFRPGERAELLGYIAKMEADAKWRSIEELRERAELLERIARAEE
jgi:hypothetical protein